MPALIVIEDGTGGHYHRAEVHLERVEQPVRREIGSDSDRMPNTRDDSLPWPTICDGCSHTFTDAAHRSATVHRVWHRPDTGEEFVRPRDAGPGAMWNAEWMSGVTDTVDGRYMVAICPDGSEWHIDGAARNCTRPNEPHDCWPRHGEPPGLTVDKHPEPGRSTCSAGAGSIATPGYHGFLRDGKFT